MIPGMADSTVLFFHSNSWNHDNLKQDGLAEAARRFDWRVQLVASRNVSGEGLAELLSFWHPVGCIFNCGDRESIPMPEDFGTTPVVYLDCQSGLFGPKANYVSHDSAETIRMCAKELMGLGVVHFAFVGHFKRPYWSEVRRRQFMEIVGAHGFPFRCFAPETAIPELEFRTELSRFLERLPTPCGLVAASDEIGEMVVVAAKRLSIRIPEHVSVVSIDNNPAVCEALSPTLTSVEIDFRAAGRLSAELLDKAIRRKRRVFETATFGPIRLVRRASSRVFSDGLAASMAELIRKRALEPIRAGDVARLGKGSRRSAEMRFRKSAGHTIMDEIHAVRLEKAKALLRYGGLPVSEVAYQCGYSSESYFRRLFKSATGLSPLKFRRRQAAKAP